MNWEKLGRILKPMKELEWMQTHAMLPTIDYIENDIYKVYFSGRDIKNRSLIGSISININNPQKVLYIPKKPVLGLGELGCFDDNGVSPTSIVTYNNDKYMYYVGWKPRSTTRMSLLPGLAISTDNGETFKRYSRAPILHLTDNEPISILTAPCVLRDEGIWKMWYVSGIEWIHPDLPRYNIKYATSKNGVDWKQTGIVCIDNESEKETALARPWVIIEDGRYKMWYSYKRSPETYRCGYAESNDGVNWIRKDNDVGIDVSESGWDSEMIEYCCIFNHNQKKYMLYNGNGYGINGFGLAVSSKT